MSRSFLRGTLLTGKLFQLGGFGGRLTEGEPFAFRPEGFLAAERAENLEIVLLEFVLQDFLLGLVTDGVHGLNGLVVEQRDSTVRPSGRCSDGSRVL